MGEPAQNTPPVTAAERRAAILALRIRRALAAE
jgi:hypothetical protein